MKGYHTNNNSTISTVPVQYSTVVCETSNDLTNYKLNYEYQHQTNTWFQFSNFKYFVAPSSFLTPKMKTYTKQQQEETQALFQYSTGTCTVQYM